MQLLYRSTLGIISVLMLIIHTLFWGIFLFAAILLRVVTPPEKRLRVVNPIIEKIALNWVGGILWWMRNVHRLELDIDHNADLTMQQWNLMIANHQSWLDIFILFFISYRKMPILKFFIKRQLIWIPVAGAAWWALDFPFMYRHSKKYLAKHPEKANQDLETTLRACEKFSHQPTSIVNFLEGTRFTHNKHREQQSPYQHLLKPKAGGIAFTLKVLGSRFDHILDTTIHYQGGAPSTWDMACGRVGKITVRLEKRAIPAAFQHMTDVQEPEIRAAFQAWVNELWREKDALLESFEKP